jgi:hypothetical protein
LQDCHLPTFNDYRSAPTFPARGLSGKEMFFIERNFERAFPGLCPKGTTFETLRTGCVSLFRFSNIRDFSQTHLKARTFGAQPFMLSDGDLSGFRGATVGSLGLKPFRQ